MRAWDFSEHPSLVSAVTRGHVPPVDAAAIACAFEGTERLLRGRPQPLAVHHTPIGRIALIVVPIVARQVYQQRPALLEAIGAAMATANALGASVASLTGLLPSATAYGQRVASPPQVTTGHATTVSAVIMMLEAGIARAGLDLSQESLAVVGVGSIGRASVDLALTALPHPREVILADVFQSTERLAEVAQTLRERHNVPVRVCLAQPGTVAEPVYESRVIVGATNAPGVLDVWRLRSGTLLVDDSAPHCFDVSQAQDRTRTQQDITIAEGGLLRAPVPLRHEVFMPIRQQSAAQAQIGATMLQQAFARDQIMGCVMSGALSARHGLPVTLGLVDPNAAIEHYRALQALGFSAPGAAALVHGTASPAPPPSNR